MIPEVFHGYKILSFCGSGAYGDVYYCEDMSGKRMALKVISKLRFGNGWERELKGVRNLHKITSGTQKLLQIYHVDEDEEYFFYSMECADSLESDHYVPDTLSNRLKKGAIPSSELFELFKNIFEAVKTLHNAGFAHRDIKPDNILFVNGKPKLADIGLLSSLSGTLTVMAGTLGFIPPELKASDLLSASDRKSRLRNDIYAFGKVVYCATTGMPPEKFPSMPKDLELYLPVKLFSNLSFSLCDPKPGKRINNVTDLEREIKGIQHKLLYGETLFEHIQGITGCLGKIISLTVRSLLLTLIILLFILGCFLSVLAAEHSLILCFAIIIFSVVFCLLLTRKVFARK